METFSSLICNQCIAMQLTQLGVKFVTELTRRVYICNLCACATLATRCMEMLKLISQIFEELNFSKKTWKIMLLILICRKWNFSTVWESLEQIVCKVLLLWRKLKHFLGKRDYCWFCGILSTSYHTTKVWYYDSRKQVILKIWRVSHIQLYYYSQILCTFYHEMWPDRDNHPNLHPTFFIYYSTTSITVVFLFKFLLFFLKIVLSFSLLLILNPCDCQHWTLKGEAWKS